MKTKVRTILHLTDSKYWGKIIEWKSEESPPHSYRIMKRPKPLCLLASDPESLPILDDRYVEFQWDHEEFLSINDKFFDHHVYYEERW
jgi:hypothetical protein